MSRCSAAAQHTFFTDGARELFDCAGQGRIDVFFLSGGQIDGEGNINLVSVGDYDHPKARFPGSFGSAYLYYVVPKVILFRVEHSRRTLVPKVDFISAPGGSPDNVFRPGGPIALVTNRCLFDFDRARRRFRLASVHPGHSVAEVIENTGFDFDRPADVPVTPAPSADTLHLMRSVVAPMLAEVYPQFARSVFGDRHSGAARRAEPGIHNHRLRSSASIVIMDSEQPRRGFRNDERPFAPSAASWSLCARKTRGNSPVQTVEAGVIGVGWIGGLRADTLSRTALVDKLHLCDIKPDRLAEVKKLYKPATATLDYNDIIKNDNIRVVYVSTTPEANHYPIARDCLKSGKNVMLEKPIALELWEADELIQLAKRNNLKFTIGYSQRFNPKIAFAKKKITDGTLGNVVSVLVSRHLSRELGKKIASRVRLSPVVMESTHDLDFVFWLLEPAKPVRVYSQGAYGYMQPINGSHDVMFTTVTMDNGVVVMIGGGWNFPPSYPNYCSTWIEITGTEGALTLDDTQRDNWLNTAKRGQEFPMSTMPGEWVDHVFAGGIGPETIHFLEACIRDTAVMVTPESARRVMETYSAADLSADRNEPIDLPLTNETISGIAELKQKNRAGLNV